MAAHANAHKLLHHHCHPSDIGFGVLLEHTDLSLVPLMYNGLMGLVCGPMPRDRYNTVLLWDHARRWRHRHEYKYPVRYGLRSHLATQLYSRGQRRLPLVANNDSRKCNCADGKEHRLLGIASHLISSHHDTMTLLRAHRTSAAYMISRSFGISLLDFR